jgi:2-phosphoglycolate phosphatase
VTATTAVLFDLDGTILDSLVDFTWVVNELRQQRHLQALSSWALRDAVTAGTDAMLERGLGVGASSPEHAQLRHSFLELYAQNVARHTRLFAGMRTVLEELSAANSPWGIVTNKHARFTEPLIDALGLRTGAACIVSGDTTPAPKPHPDGLKLAATHLERSPKECIYIGDAHTDVLAAHAAGMRSAVALYGYIPTSAGQRPWNAHHYLDSPAHVLTLPGVRALMRRDPL